MSNLERFRGLHQPYHGCTLQDYRDMDEASNYEHCFIILLSFLQSRMQWPMITFFSQDGQQIVMRDDRNQSHRILAGFSLAILATLERSRYTDLYILSPLVKRLFWLVWR